MGVFKDPQEIYQYIGGIFETGFKDPELGPKFSSVGTIIKLNLTDPDSSMVIDFRDGVVEYGDAATRKSEVEMVMSADTCHSFWLGNVNVGVSIAKGKMKVKGSVPKVMKIVPITKPLFAAYRSLLETAGRQDLIAAG